MVTIVVLINTFISLSLLYAAWRITQIKTKIGFIADRLLDYERCSHNFLYQAPERIYLGQVGIKSLRQGNQGIQVQIQQIRQIINLLLLGQRTWRRYIPRANPRNRKTNF